MSSTAQFYHFCTGLSSLHSSVDEDIKKMEKLLEKPDFEPGFLFNRRPLSLHLIQSSAKAKDRPERIPSLTHLLQILIEKGHNPWAVAGGSGTAYGREGAVNIDVFKAALSHPGLLGLELLLEHPGWQALDRKQLLDIRIDDQTCLEMAGRRAEVTRCLLRYGVLDINDTDFMGKTALHHARSPEAAEVLIRAGADPRCLDSSGRTPYMHQDELGQLNSERRKQWRDIGAAKVTPDREFYLLRGRSANRTTIFPNVGARAKWNWSPEGAPRALTELDALAMEAALEPGKEKPVQALVRAWKRASRTRTMAPSLNTLVQWITLSLPSDLRKKLWRKELDEPAPLEQGQLAEAARDFLFAFKQGKSVGEPLHIPLGWIQPLTNEAQYAIVKVWSDYLHSNLAEPEDWGKVHSIIRLKAKEATADPETLFLQLPFQDLTVEPDLRGRLPSETTLKSLDAKSRLTLYGLYVIRVANEVFHRNPSCVHPRLPSLLQNELLPKLALALEEMGLAQAPASLQKALKQTNEALLEQLAAYARQAHAQRHSRKTRPGRQRHS